MIIYTKNMLLRMYSLYKFRHEFVSKNIYKKKIYFERKIFINYKKIPLIKLIKLIKLLKYL